MAAVAVAKLDVLESTMKQKRLRPSNIKLVRRLQPKDGHQKRTNNSYVKTVEVNKNEPNKVALIKKKVRQSTKVKRSSHTEDDKKDALETCLRTVKVARNQLLQELLLQLKKHYYLDLESYDAHSLEFLKIPDSQNMEIQFLADMFKKCYVVAEQMVKENVDHQEYQASLKSAINQISQVTEVLERTAILVTGKFPSKKDYPELPNELKTENRSRRQNRDYLFVKEYKNILEVTEQFLKNY